MRLCAGETAAIDFGVALLKRFLGTLSAQILRQIASQPRAAAGGSINKLIIDAAIAYGLSASHFSKCYRLQYGHSPQQTRLERWHGVSGKKMQTRAVR
ncbi:helix-turn-helix transcriptional regulator [Phyllobacterium zundukense]|uniref:HTH araC/xylS-type domain-containing protein n=1 Tax=Phyllobacterium zundukense TaxID=1867719 RepID=A0A2N9VUR0_9HYPH|nr:AraC family transcriptional regulator [Phyllobacterium zundukense]ATU95318.1 hypothetical protein BLM14_26770 [Phyllobacterium zundukense]PIO43228.1 hypothetical protein B5P45_19315 [Phyllobacterium zundukense]